MSLDVYLKMPGAHIPSVPTIYIRADGATKAVTREEWDARFPDKEPVACSHEDGDEVFHGNITHNLNTYAEAFGLYMPLWRPEEIGITHAQQLIYPLAAGLTKLLEEQQRHQHAALLPANGWGTHEGLVEFVQNYLAACLRFPDAEVSTWR